MRISYTVLFDLGQNFSSIGLDKIYDSSDEFEFTPPGAAETKTFEQKARQLCFQRV